MSGISLLRRFPERMKKKTESCKSRRRYNLCQNDEKIESRLSVVSVERSGVRELFALLIYPERLLAASSHVASHPAVCCELTSH